MHVIYLECPYLVSTVLRQCYVCMTCNTPTPGHPSTADDAWYWQKRILHIPFLHLGLCVIYAVLSQGSCGSLI